MQGSRMNLGERIVEAARLASRMHVSRSILPDEADSAASDGVLADGQNASVSGHWVQAGGAGLWSQTLGPTLIPRTVHGREKDAA